MDGSPFCTRRLWPEPTRVPCSSKMAAPMGMPPSASPLRASAMAAASMAWWSRALVIGGIIRGWRLRRAITRDSGGVTLRGNTAMMVYVGILRRSLPAAGWLVGSQDLEDRANSSVVRAFPTGRGIFDRLSCLRQRRQKNAVLWLGCSLRILHNDEPSIT